jgi:hypothetical protein
MKSKAIWLQKFNNTIQRYWNGWNARQVIQKTSFKNNLRVLKLIDEWSKETNSRPGWESCQHGWEIQQRKLESGKNMDVQN